MISQDEIHNILAEALEITQEGSEATHKYSPSLSLMGVDGILDSLDTMLFLDNIDDLLTRKMGKSVAVAMDSAFEHEENPYRTMQSLAEYLTSVLNGENGQE